MNFQTDSGVGQAALNSNFYYAGDKIKFLGFFEIKFFRSES